MFVYLLRCTFEVGIAKIILHLRATSGIQQSSTPHLERGAIAEYLDCDVTI